MTEVLNATAIAMPIAETKPTRVSELSQLLSVIKHNPYMNMVENTRWFKQFHPIIKRKYLACMNKVMPILMELGFTPDSFLISYEGVDYGGKIGREYYNDWWYGDWVHGIYNTEKVKADYDAGKKNVKWVTSFCVNLRVRSKMNPKLLAFAKTYAPTSKMEKTYMRFKGAEILKTSQYTVSTTTDWKHLKIEFYPVVITLP